MLLITTKINDLEQQLCTLFQKYVFRAHHENLNEDRSILSWKKCSPVMLVSGNVRFMQIPVFAGFPWRGASIGTQEICHP